MSDFNEVIRQLENQKSELESQLTKVSNAVEALKGMGKNGTVRTPSAGPRRVMSASARRRIVAAQKARWAKWRAMKKRGN